MSRDNHFDLGAESGEDAVASTVLLERRLAALDERKSQLSDAVERALIDKDASDLLLELGRQSEVWERARPAFEVCRAAERWQDAAELCACLYRADQPGSLAALGQGVWLAVTYPVEPQTTLELLRYVVEDTPDRSDGAAVAAAAAAYIVDLRAGEEQHRNLHFFAMQLLGEVARRHSGVEDQPQFEAWMKRLELDDPAKFLVRLRNVVDVLVQDDWWFDRVELQSRLPVN
jgi:hypothetical protein